MEDKFFRRINQTIFLIFAIFLTICAFAFNTYADAEEQTNSYYTEDDVVMLAKVMWGEAKGIQSDTECAYIAWTVLNRVDSEKFPNTIQEVLEAPNQHHYNRLMDVEARFMRLARSVLEYWAEEKETGFTSGRILPKEYLFYGRKDSQSHYFRTTAKLDYRNNFDKSLTSPYDN